MIALKFDLKKRQRLLEKRHARMNTYIISYVPADGFYLHMQSHIISCKKRRHFQ